MSYENPQRIVNKSFEVLAKAQARNNAITQNNFEALAKSQRYNKKRQQEIYLHNEKARATFQNKFDSIDTSKFEGTFDDNLRMFFDDRVDKYFEVKNLITNGDIDKREGQRVLSGMNKQVNKFKEMVPLILELAMEMNGENIKPGTQGGISSALTSSAVTGIFSKLGKTAESGNIRLVEDHKTGEFFLVDLYDINKDNKIDEEDYNVLKKEGFTSTTYKGGDMVNLDEVLKNPDKVIKRVSDVDSLTDKVFDHLIEPDNMENDNAYITFGIEDEVRTDAEGKTTNMENTYRYVTLNQIDKMKQDMKANRAFDVALDDDEYMFSVWGDLMDNNSIYGQGGHLIDKKMQKDVSRAWLIDHAIETNLLKLGLIKTEEDKDGNIIASRDQDGNLIPIKENGKGQFVSSRSKDNVNLHHQQQGVIDDIENRGIKDTFTKFLAQDNKSNEDIVEFLNLAVGDDGTYSLGDDGEIKRGKITLLGMRDDSEEIVNDKLLKELAMAMGASEGTAMKYVSFDKKKNNLP